MSNQFTKWQDMAQKPALGVRASQMEDLRQRVHARVIEALGPMLDDGGHTDTELRRAIVDTIHKALAEDSLVLSGTERAEMVQEVTD